MTIYLTSDQHFYHSNVLIYSSRDFATIEEMNEQIILRHNEVVKPEDTVYHLGDFTFKDNKVNELLSQLNGTHHLIAGNHDKAHSSKEKHRKEIRKYLDYGFSSVQEQMELKIGDKAVLLCHLPYLNEEDQDQRFKQWRPIDKGGWLLHGHIHQLYLWRRRMINVGVDVWNYYPVSESQILDLMAEITEGEQL